MGRIGSGGTSRTGPGVTGAGRTGGATRIGGVDVVVGGATPGSVLAGSDVGPTLFPGITGAPLVTRVVIADNAPFIDRVDQDKLLDSLVRPTRTVVVTQNPAPGDQVPLGTQISVTITVKGLIPTDVLEVNPKVVGTWATIGALEDAVGSFDDADALRGVLAGGTPYEDLSGSQKEIADGFLGSVADLEEDERASAFDDIGFLFNL